MTNALPLRLRSRCLHVAVISYFFVLRCEFRRPCALMLISVKMSTEEKKYKMQINIMNVLSYFGELNLHFSSLVLQYSSLIAVLFSVVLAAEAGQSQSLSDEAVWMSLR